jgi:Tfp pilus assembly PilM family ATPase
VADILSRLPQSAKRRFVSLNIDGSDLRIIALDGLQITRFVTRPLDSFLLPDGIVANPPAFGAAVRTILNEYEIAGGPVVAGFADVGVHTRLLLLPRRRDLNVSDEVKRVTKTDPLLAPETNRLFHQVVDEQADQVTVFILAVRREPLAAFMAGLGAAGIDPLKVELRPLALVRGVGQSQIVIAHAERTICRLLCAAWR